MPPHAFALEWHSRFATAVIVDSLGFANQPLVRRLSSMIMKLDPKTKTRLSINISSLPVVAAQRHFLLRHWRHAASASGAYCPSELRSFFWPLLPGRQLRKAGRR